MTTYLYPSCKFDMGIPGKVVHVYVTQIADIQLTYVMECTDVRLCSGMYTDIR